MEMTIPFNTFGQRFSSMTDQIQNQEGEPTFEDFRNDNGIPFWWASDLSQMLGYESYKSFRKVIDRAIKAMMAIDVSYHDNVIAHDREDAKIVDFKLSRFACYMVVMNADSKKPEVAKAQAYFATMTRTFEVMIQESDQIERLIIRDDIKEGNKALTNAAKNAGITDYARFQNAGYMGLYNMGNWQLAKMHSIDKTKLFDHMGRAELAANLFRITMTEERIKSKNVKGQNQLEKTHKEVGKEIRNVVKQNTGKFPENLPVEGRPT